MYILHILTFLILLQQKKEEVTDWKDSKKGTKVGGQKSWWLITSRFEGWKWGDWTDEIRSVSEKTTRVGKGTVMYGRYLISTSSNVHTYTHICVCVYIDTWGVNVSLPDEFKW